MKTVTRRVATALRRSLPQAPPTTVRDPRVDGLIAQVEHLEAELEGLQDAVYRQDVLHGRQIADLRERRPEVPSPARRQERP